MKKELIRVCLILLIPIIPAALLNVIPFTPPFGSTVVESNQMLVALFILLYFINVPGIDFAIAVLCATRRQAFEKLGFVNIFILISVFGFLDVCTLEITERSWEQTCFFTIFHLAIAILITLIRFWRYKRSISPEALRDSDRSNETF